MLLKVLWLNEHLYLQSCFLPFSLTLLMPGTNGITQICSFYFTKILKRYFPFKKLSQAIALDKENEYKIFQQDLLGEIRKVATFLGKSLSEEQLTGLREHLKFDKFSKNESVNMEMVRELGGINPDGHFIRKGIASVRYYHNN